MEKINIAELLKDCPKGMELDCASYDNVSFDKISDDKKAAYPIFCYITDKEGNRSGISFTENGCESKRYGAKCVIFPKGKTTWEGFTPPVDFKDGDIVSTDSGAWVGITVGGKPKEFIPTYCVIKSCGEFKAYLGKKGMWAFNRLATEDEKEKLFNTIKENGYRWDNETKTLVKLVPNKFDINVLVPFESKVLVSDYGRWMPAVYGGYNKSYAKPFFVIGGNCYSKCIPYEGNEYLSGTTKDCSDFYKIWEK